MGQLIECNGTDDGPRWGYSRCATFTLLDQNGRGITSGNFTASEIVSTINSNPPGLQANQGGGPLVSGAFMDFWAFVARSSPPPQPGEFVIARQNITITDNLTGRQFSNIRINCLNFQSTDVTVKDITTSGTCP